MPVTPLVRWKNFNENNLSAIINLYPRWNNALKKSTLVKFMEDRLPSYGRTAYQYAAQLGLENREDPNDIRINDFLNASDRTEIANYLKYWMKTYYVPNFATQRNGQVPFIIYTQLAEKVLSIAPRRLSFTDFLNENDINSGSNDILFNALKNYAFPLKCDDATNEVYIEEENIDLLLSEVIQIKTTFPIPVNSSGRVEFYNRYRKENLEMFKKLFLHKKINEAHNRLLNGAPGTGKSHLLDKDVKKYLDFDYENRMERVTFHLTYSYQQFIGTYKPVPSAGSITYKYVPGPFLRLLVKAIEDYENYGDNSSEYIIVIEELNRAKNPSAVFGDIFQLLDRHSDGLSKYPVTCSDELLEYLSSVRLGHLNSLYLPPNFYIWATMNNADQGVQLIDSAFFRRWTPEYININNEEEVISSIEVNIKGYGTCNWNKFRKELNNRLLKLGIKEDKLIGPFFIEVNSFESEIVFQEIFVNKLLRYLFEDVMKFDHSSLFVVSSHFNEVVEFYEENNVIFKELDINTFKL